MKDACIRLGGVYDVEKQSHQGGSVWSTNALMPTITAMAYAGNMPFIIVKRKRDAAGQKS